jgi:hypothetical protein
VKRLSATAALAAVLVAGCGATHTITAPPPASSPKAPAPAIVQPAAGCPVGQSFMGCSTTLTRSLSAGVRPPGKYFPDVSSFQGSPNWTLAKGSIAGAAAKLGEGATIFDASATYNFAQLQRLGIPHLAYWFVRGSGCAAEGDAIKAAVSRVGGVRLLVLDEEVPGISGYAACLNPYVVSATGQNAVVYRSSGNDFDDSAPALSCWVAAYGPSVTPTCSSRRVVAWQFTDGRFGFPLFIPGVGQGDVSVDHGLLALVAPPKPKPKPFALAPNTRRTFGHAQHRVTAREHLNLVTWRSEMCKLPARRAVCKRTRAHGLLLEHRIYVIATRHGHLKKGHRRWKRDHLGARYAYLAHGPARRE